MHKSFKRIINEYFNFLKKDRKGIIILCILIVLSIAVNIVLNNFPKQSKYDYAEFEKLFDEWEINNNKQIPNKKILFTFNPNVISEKKLDSLDIPEFVKRNIISYRTAGGNFSSPSQLRKIYGMNDSVFNRIEKYIDIPEKITIERRKSLPSEIISGYFNPNTVGIDSLKYFGFNQFQAQNLIKFRNTGGVFKSTNDLLKVYGVDSSFVNAIKEHIYFSSAIQKKVEIHEPVFSIVELNNADTTELIQLPGVGSVFANRIIKYRNLLGGFNNTSQLLEVYNFPEETYNRIENLVEADSSMVKLIRINFAEYPELLKHPYLNKTQVKSLLKYRDENGVIKSVKEIEKIQEIDLLTFSKISPYLTCR